MKIVEHHYYDHNKNHEVSLAEAIEGTLNRSYYGEGELEYLQSNLKRQSSMIVAIIQLLVDKEVLTLEDIKPMLNYEYQVED